MRIRGYKCDLARSAEHDKSFMCPDLTSSEMSFIWERGAGSALVQCQEQLLQLGSGQAAEPLLRHQGPAFSYSWEAIQAHERANQAPRLLPSLWKSSTESLIVAQGQGKVDSGFCVSVAGGDLDAKTFQNVRSKHTINGKSFLNVSLL